MTIDNREIVNIEPRPKIFHSTDPQGNTVTGDCFVVRFKDGWAYYHPHVLAEKLAQL
jgi:hypothetical protein